MTNQRECFISDLIARFHAVDHLSAGELVNAYEISEGSGIVKLARSQCLYLKKQVIEALLVSSKPKEVNLDDVAWRAMRLKARVGFFPAKETKGNAYWSCWIAPI